MTSEVQPEEHYQIESVATKHFSQITLLFGFGI
jgi:hypothetical protein